MLPLKEYRHTARALPDLLPYAFLVRNGVVLQKDGSLLAGYLFRGQDTASSTDDELAGVSHFANNALRQLGTGWCCHVEALRVPAPDYPDPQTCYFPTQVPYLIDAERRDAFNNDDHAHYVTRTYFFATYHPPYVGDALAKHAYSSNTGQPEALDDLSKALETFEKMLSAFVDVMASAIHMSRLRDYDDRDEFGMVVRRSPLLSILQFCLTGNLHPFTVPPVAMYLDGVIGGQHLVGGLQPSIGGKRLVVIGIDGLPTHTYPAMLNRLESLPATFRFSTRFLFLDQFMALKEVDKYRKTWRQKIFRLTDVFFNNPNSRPDRDAQNMSEDAEQAYESIQGGLVSAGFYTANVVLLLDEGQDAEELFRAVRQHVSGHLGMGCRLESINSIEAWLGSLPGNIHANVRRPVITSLNLADLIPLSSTWSGHTHCPCPFYPPESPPLMYCTTGGSTPYRLNLHVGDVGHTLIFGPTGAGKSVLLCMIAAQFLRYSDATIFSFDKGRSMLALCDACEGTHYDIASDASPLAFAPLQRVDTGTAEMAFAASWLETCCTLQGLAVLPEHRNEISHALGLLSENPADMRSLTDFSNLVQSQEIKSALEHYTHGGAMGHLLDASEDTLGLSWFTVFEMEELMSLGEKNLLPVLTYLFHRLEQALHGQPCLLILDEAWVMLGHPVFREKIREWLKVLRKANCAVVMATQSLSDASKSGILDVLVESCPTKIFLPNSKCRQEGIRETYRSMGLNERQISIVAEATPKRDYYVTSEEGNRLVNLNLGPVALALAVSDKDSLARITALKAEHGRSWPQFWLAERKAR